MIQKLIQTPLLWYWNKIGQNNELESVKRIIMTNFVKLTFYWSILQMATLTLRKIINFQLKYLENENSWVFQIKLLLLRSTSMAGTSQLTGVYRSSAASSHLSLSWASLMQKPLFISSFTTSSHDFFRPSSLHTS